MADNADNFLDDYSPDVEQLFIQFFLSEPELYTRCRNIVKSEHYEEPEHVRTMDFVIQHCDEYKAMPTVDQVKAVTGKIYQLADEVTDQHKEWFLDNYEQFARHKEIVAATLNAPKMIEKKQYGELEKAIKEAVQVGLVKDLGLDYYKNPLERMKEMFEDKPLISTGWKDLDEVLFGGVEPGSLNIFCGQSGAGKSLFLQNEAVIQSKLGKNVVYITLELSENLCALRLDAMISGRTTKAVRQHQEDAAAAIMTAGRKSKGAIHVKKFPSGATAAQFRSFLKELMIQTGKKIDVICIDYLDLCHPYRMKVNASDTFTKDKYVSEELRDLADEFGAVMYSASQLNRDSHETQDFGHHHIAGGISKINTADNVFGIFVTNAMKEKGRYQLQMLKTRTSSGVGKRVDLKFDPPTMRIMDLPEGEEGAIDSQTSYIMDAIKSGGAGGQSDVTNGALNKPASGSSMLDAFKSLRQSTTNT